MRLVHDWGLDVEALRALTAFPGLGSGTQPVKCSKRQECTIGQD